MQIEPWLFDFIQESNRIEGIHEVFSKDKIAHVDLLAAETVTVKDLEVFVQWIAPGHRLRDKPGLNVMVGNHIPPEGGPEIRDKLYKLLNNLNLQSPFGTHCKYESLHPFTDGNGRSGRALWLWQMLRTSQANLAKALGFLHPFYYQTLAASEDRNDN